MPFARIKRWRRERRWRRAQRKNPGPLREFVYLDEVSVYSLVASQVGLIVTEVTDTQAASLQTEVSANAGVAGPVKAELGAKLQSSSSQSSQVLRKAVVQTTFKELREAAEISGALRVHSDAPVPSVRSVGELRSLADEEGAAQPLIASPEHLHRGSLIEVDVELEAEPIFQAETAVSGLLDIVQDNPAAFGIHSSGELGQAQMMFNMLEKMLAGLVPVRGRATDFEAAQIDGERWLVHSAILDGLPDVERSPVHVVGVAQETLFWKDVRRVLFSGSKYRVLARLNQTGLQTSWRPAKLVDVLSLVVPEFAGIVDDLNRGVLTAMMSGGSAHKAKSAGGRARAIVDSYVELLSERSGVEISDEDLERCGLRSIGPVENIGVREWRDLLAPLTALVAERSGQPIEREAAADLRAAAVAVGGSVELATATSHEPLSQPNDLFLDSEIVAVYW